MPQVSLMSVDPSDHPADRLALALSRASGIVASVEHCFSERSNDFAVTAAFIAHALKTVENFIDEASRSLSDLNRDFDLSITKGALANIANARAAGESVDNEIRGSVATLSPHEEDDQTDDLSARTYDELLAKVTAAEVFATNQARQNESENDLVPLLNSLKADLLRLRSVA